MFLFRWFKWLSVGYLIVVCVFYFWDAWNFLSAGKGALDSIAWIFYFPEHRKSFLYLVFYLSAGWWLATAFLLIFILYLFDDLEELNNLREKIQSSEGRLLSLKTESENLEKEIQRLKEEKEDLKIDIESFEEEKALLVNDIKELLEKERNLSIYIEETLQRAYKEGKEKGYQAVIAELRSLRSQKSALLDLFDNNDELKKLFKKITGKTIRQYLNEVKKKAKGSGGKS